jgi:hypothetical protein
MYCDIGYTDNVRAIRAALSAGKMFADRKVSTIGPRVATDADGNNLPSRHPDR